MTTRDVEVASLISAYREAAKGNFEAHAKGDPDGTARHARTLAATRSKLKARGRDAEMELVALLGDADPSVRCWAAADVLELEPEKATAVLRRLIAEGGFEGFSARILLEQWQKRRE